MKLLIIAALATSAVFAQRNLTRQIEDLALRIADNARTTNVSRRELMRVKSMLERANETLTQGTPGNPGPNPNPNPGPRPRPGHDRLRYVGTCTIDDDSDVDNTVVGNVYGSDQMEVLDICQMIAEKVFRTRAFSKVMNVRPVNGPIYALSATCAIDDDQDVDNSVVKIFAKNTQELLDSCDVLAKNVFKSQAYSKLTNIQSAQDYTRVEANCTIDDDSDVDNSNVGKVYGSSVIEVAGICQQYAERRFQTRAYSKLSQIIAL